MGSQTDTFSTVHHLPLAALGFVIAPYLTAVLYLEATHTHEEKVFYPHMVGVNLLLSVCANSCHHVCDCRCSLPSLFFTSFFFSLHSAPAGTNAQGISLEGDSPCAQLNVLMNVWFIVLGCRITLLPPAHPFVMPPIPHFHPRPRRRRSAHCSTSTASTSGTPHTTSTAPLLPCTRRVTQQGQQQRFYIDAAAGVCDLILCAWFARPVEVSV